MVTDEREGSPDEASIREAKPPARDAVAEVMRANLRRALLGVDAPAPTLGRFTVLERIGGGAMGTVLAAYDPVLDRKVAIKVLRERGEAAKARVLSEARALARLSHPNVVAVHEADEHEGEVYIAMEFVRGVDLRAWLDERAHPWPEVVPILADAARGLAAAHAAGVIHCDFKPDNVLLGEDGVRVVDFGLAHRGGGEASEARGSDGGTPLYMAPERLAGEPATAASDQFAFGVTLHEALHGRHPFAERGRGSPRAAIERGPPRAEPPRPIPRWLDELVARMLAPRPEDRLPSMDAVVVELARPRRAGRRWALGGLVTATLLATGWAAYQRGTERDPCDGGEAAARAVWDEPRAAALSQALTRSGAPFAASTAARVDESLDDYRERWAATHREICEATRVHGTQSDTTYDLRMRCLERGLGELSALLEAIEATEATDTESAARAIEATHALPPPHDCDATRATEIRYAQPAGAQQRQRVLALRPQLDRAWASFRTGRYAEARTRAERVRQQAEAIAFPPLLAEAQHLHGAVLGRVGGLDEAESMLRRAMLTAAEVEDDALVAEIAVRLLRAIMFAHDPERVMTVADFVRASILRAGGDVREVDGIVGEAQLGAGDATGAIESLRRALDSERRVDRIAILQTTLGSALLARGEHEAALALYAEALASATTFYGSGHPSVGFFLHRLGRGQREAGRLDAAHQTLTEVLALREAALGPADRAVASTLIDLALTELARGDPGSAELHLRRALGIREAVYGPDHARVAELLLPLGDAQQARGQPEQARRSYERALGIREATTPEHPQLDTLRLRLRPPPSTPGEPPAASGSPDRPSPEDP